MLEAVKPREQNGRDSFGRYRAQVRSAAIASLAILDGQLIDRVYCDLHDDFVVRLNDKGEYCYIFFQVKTKGKRNHNWSLNEIFGLNTKIKNKDMQDISSIKDSFAGKLLMHTVNFEDKCRAVVFQTNVHTDDNIEELVESIKNDNYGNKYADILLCRFNECFVSNPSANKSEEDVKNNLKKLQFETDVQYLKDGISNFEPIAREKIFEYSEVDLQHDEVKEILLKLVDLVERKSSGVIVHYTSEEIEQYAGISIEDLLGILSISRNAYENLVNGDDRKAIKSASIIQRVLLSAGATMDQVVYCSRCKTDWDGWMRKNRHIIKEFDLIVIVDKIRNTLNLKTNNGSIDFCELKIAIEKLILDLKSMKLAYDLTGDLILGAMFSELIKDNA